MRIAQMSIWMKPKDFNAGFYPVVSRQRDGKKEYTIRHGHEVYFGPEAAVIHK